MGGICADHGVARVLGDLILLECLADAVFAQFLIQQIGDLVFGVLHLSCLVKGAVGVLQILLQTVHDLVDLILDLFVQGGFFHLFSQLVDQILDDLLLFLVHGFGIRFPAEGEQIVGQDKDSCRQEEQTETERGDPAGKAQLHLSRSQGGDMGAGVLSL